MHTHTHTPQGYGFRPVYQGEDVKFTCSGLHRNTSYNFRLSAANEKGHSQYSPSVTCQTLPDVPGPPGAPFLKKRATPTSLNITWQPPSDNGGSEVEAYVLQMSSSDGSSPSGALVDVYTGPELSYLAEGLNSGKNYQCQVNARVSKTNTYMYSVKSLFYVHTQLYFIPTYIFSLNLNNELTFHCF